MASLDALFDFYSRFMVSRGKYLVAPWIILLVALSPYALTIGHIISYSINVPSSDKESQTAQNLLNAQFRANESANTTAFLILEGQNVLSTSFYERFLELNSTLYARLGQAGLNKTVSIYGFEHDLLSGFVDATVRAINVTENLVNSTSAGLNGLAQNLSDQSKNLVVLEDNVSVLASSMWNLTHALDNLSAAAQGLAQNLKQLNAGLYTLQERVYKVVNQTESLEAKINSTNLELYELRSQVNSSLQLVYGIPRIYVEIWLSIASQTDYTQPPQLLDWEANQTFYWLEAKLTSNATVKLYYTLFYYSWSNLTANQTTPDVASHVYDYADLAVEAAVDQFAKAVGLSGKQAEFFQMLASYFNITDFGSPMLVDQFTLGYATLGLNQSEAEFVQACFNLGPNPTKQQLDNLTLYYATLNLSQEEARFVTQAFYGVEENGLEGFVKSYFEHQVNATNPNITEVLERFNTTLAQLVEYAYELGSPPNQSLLENYTVTIVLGALPPQLSRTLQSNFNVTPQNFVVEAVVLGYPPNEASVESYVVSLFSRSLVGSIGGANTTKFLQEVYALGESPTHEASLSLAVNVTLEALTPEERENITRNFGLTPQTYLHEVGSLGYPPDQEALANLTVQLFEWYLWSNRPDVAENITQNYNLSLREFLSQVYWLGRPITPQRLQALAAPLAYRLIVLGEKDQPFFEYNQHAVNETIGLLLNHTERSEAVRELMGRHDLFGLPVRPAAGLLYEFVNPGLNTTLVTLVFDAAPTEATLREFERLAAAFNTSDFKVYYTSAQIISDGLKGVVTKSELYSIPFGVAAAILITALYFSSPVAALIPMLVFGVGAAVGFGLIHLYLGYYEHTSLSYISPVIILILSLGLATDYSVLILNRFRQELEKGERRALALSTRWAGEAVFTSGLTVILSYVVLSAAHIPLFSDVGTANALIVTSILAASLSFLPALLALLGRRVFWPNRVFEHRPSRLAKATRRALSRPKTVAGLMLALTVVAALVASNLPVNIDFLALTPAGPGKTGLDQVSQSYGGNTLIPTYVVVGLPAKLSSGANQFNNTELEALANLTATMRGAKDVVAVYGPTAPYNYTIPYDQLASFEPAARAQYASAILNYVSKDNTSVYFEVVFAGDPFGNKVLQDAVTLKEAVHRALPAGYTAYVGGASLDAQAALSYVFEVLPKIVLILVSAIYVVLLIQLRSAFTPLRLIATVLSAIVWTLLLCWVIFYKLGGTSVFIFAPLFLVTTMLGVGVDYDIFMMTRVREEARKGFSDEEAIVKTAETTAGAITTLGLILSAVFFGLTLTRIELVQQVGLSLATGILLDTFVVWLIFVPSIMALAKRLNWWPSDPRREPLREA